MPGLLKINSFTPLLPAGLDGAVHIDGIIRPLGDGNVAGLLQIAVEGVHGEVRLQGGEGLPLLEEPGEQHGNQLVRSRCLRPTFSTGTP